MTTLLVSLLDAAIVLGIGLVIVMLLRRRAASLRHAVLASAIVCALAMPAFEVLLPQVPLIRAGGSEAWASSTTWSSDALAPFAVGGSSGRSGADVPWLQVFVVAWLTGAMVLACRLLAGFVRLRQLKRRCAPVAGRWRELTDELSSESGVAQPVRLLQSGDRSLLITCGLFRPVIILPDGASSWPDDRCRAVLRHELAHATRHDATVQIVAESLRAAQWVNPLVWLACRRLREESEYACDDAVLRGGVEATEYATHLLDIARDLSGHRAAWVSAPAIAHPSTLERRIVAMLQAQRNRAPLGHRGWALAAVAAFAVSIPLAAAGVAPLSETIAVSSAAPDVTLATIAAESAPPAPQAKGSIAGTIVDQTGGTMPGVRVTVTNTSSGAQAASQTDAMGQFVVGDLPAGEYQLVARIQGFATVTNNVKLAPGATIQGSLTMPLGTLMETVNVACTAASGMVPSGSPGNTTSPTDPGRVVPIQDGRVRVGGNVRAPRKLRDVKPACPAEAVGVRATVRVTARIGTDGAVFDIVPVPGAAGAEPPSPLVESVIDAVGRWVFTPTLLNGQPVDVGMTVQVNFQ